VKYWPKVIPFRRGLTYRHKGLGKKSPYTVSFGAQVFAIFKRQLLLKFQDTFGVTTGYATSIIIALIVGSVFFQLPETASGAFTRGGLLFLGILFSKSLVPSQHRSGTLCRSADPLRRLDILFRIAKSDDGQKCALQAGRISILPTWSFCKLFDQSEQSMSSADRVHRLSPPYLQISLTTPRTFSSSLS